MSGEKCKQIRQGLSREHFSHQFPNGQSVNTAPVYTSLLVDSGLRHLELKKADLIPSH
jgi:hypothetical protein